jgi:hypothetical protein
VPCVLLSPMIALLLAIAIEIVVLPDAGAPALLVVVGAGGLFLLRKLRAHPQRGVSAEA